MPSELYCFVVPRVFSRFDPFFILFPGLVALRRGVVRVVRTAGTSSASRGPAPHIEAIVQHVGNTVHIQVLIRGGDLTQGRANDAEIAPQLADHSSDFLGIGQDLDTHGVGIVAHSKGSLDALGKGPLDICKK